jgi:hypothetical protein
MRPWVKRALVEVGLKFMLLVALVISTVTFTKVLTLGVTPREGYHVELPAWAPDVMGHALYVVMPSMAWIMLTLVATYWVCYVRTVSLVRRRYPRGA